MIWRLQMQNLLPLVAGAMVGIRDKLYYQIHFGANYETGSYGWTTDLDVVKRSVAWQLDMLKTDYIDFGFIHCIDELSDFDKVVSNGILDYIQELKCQGIVRHIGLSSHTPELSDKVLDTGLIDMLYVQYKSRL